MFDGLRELFQIDWQIFMAGTDTWLHGGNPYGTLNADLGAGAFAYPPTALPWLTLFWLTGPLGFYLWTAGQLAGWWWLIKDDRKSQLILLCWSPLILHFVQGQSTLPVVLVIWAAFQSPRRGLLWGAALAWALTKPQVALIPLLYLLWQDRGAEQRWRLWVGILGGTLLLALVPTLRNPGIWFEWLAGLGAYRERILQLAAWQGPSIVLLVLAAYLWHRGSYRNWHWWLTAGLFPHTSFYAMVALMPALRPPLTKWPLIGIALAGVVQGPMAPQVLPWILAIHMLAGWMIAGGPRASVARTPVPAVGVNQAT